VDGVYRRVVATPPHNPTIASKGHKPVERILNDYAGRATSPDMAPGLLRRNGAGDRVRQSVLGQRIGIEARGG
jgi:hypothetical protein